MNIIRRKLRSLRIHRNRARSKARHRHGGQYQVIFENKHFLTALLKGWGLSAPRDLALVTGAGASWLGADSRHSTPWPDWLADLQPGPYFLKPVRGNHGRHAGRLDVEVHRVRFNGKLLASDRKLSAFCDDDQDFLLQEWIEQHPQMARHSDRTVNTIRALTLRVSPVKVVLLHAVMRNGRLAHFLDNFHAGGIAVGIDLESGKTAGKGVQLRPRRTMSQHPDSGQPLTGNVVPFFRELRELVIGAHSMFPELRSVGWDVAIAVDGPVIVEGNLDWDAEIHAFCDPGFRAMLDRQLKQLY